MKVLSQRYVLLTISVLAAFATFINLSVWPSYLAENIAFRLDPSAARAFAYGEHHFNAGDPREYNIDRAEYFFREATARDVAFPYAHHELARISFLRGNYSKAMGDINFQIYLYGTSTPNSYYIRALIEGYRGEYQASARDYAIYLESDPHNWAALNDYAWVLIKAGEFKKAVEVTSRGLELRPDNPWLLNSHAIALFELGEYRDALATIQVASRTVKDLTPNDWLKAYPGNDPRLAAQGLATFRDTVAKNMHMIELEFIGGTLQSDIRQ